MSEQTVSARVTPEVNLEVLSQVEVNRLADTSSGGLGYLFRQCALAVLNSGSQVDDTAVILEMFKDFDIQVVQQERGIKLDITNAPASAFVDGQMLKGIKEHLFAVLRDIIYISNEIEDNKKFNLQESQGLTNAIFHILRNAGILKPRVLPNIVVCWGGHSINDEEYQYTKKVGYELGLRGIDICTGCGPGAMKGPMKGAAIAHAKQRIEDGRYIGISEPGIIAVESPNAIVNQLVVMPDIEKRLEAFVRVGHGIVVFPGGVGTAEEILYLLGLLLHPKNADIPMPIVFTGPRSTEDYFKQIDAFIGETIGPSAQGLYEIVVDNPKKVARILKSGMETVRQYRRSTQDAYFFNWMLNIDHDLQEPFKPTHEKMKQLNLSKNQKPHELAANLRRAFSGIVDGNVKENGIKAIEEKGPFEIHGESAIMEPLDKLLASFVKQNRMKIPTKEYIPCYKLVS
ncbi:MAG: nucleotide 5'-monophosphate nucleosidase PpnN [Pseudomonadota bacterium]